MAKPTTKQEMWSYTATNSRSRRRVKREEDYKNNPPRELEPVKGLKWNLGG